MDDFRRRGGEPISLQITFVAESDVTLEWRKSRRYVQAPDSILIVESDDGTATVYLPAVDPRDMYVLTSRGELRRLANKRVNVVSDDIAVTAAFVYYAKPWLRFVSINNIPITFT